MENIHTITINLFSLGPAMGSASVFVLFLFSISLYIFAYRDEHFLYFAFLQISMSIFLGGYAVYSSSSNDQRILFWTRITYTGVSLAPLSFQLLMQKIIKNTNRVISIALTFLTILWLIGIWSNTTYIITQERNLLSDYPSMIKGSLFPLYVTTIFLPIFYIYWIFFSHFLKSPKFRKLAWPLLFGFSFQIINSIHDALGALHIVRWGTVTWTGPLVMVVMIGLFLGKYFHQTQERLKQINSEKEILYNKMIRDSMTGAFSRSYFESILEHRLKLAKRSNVERSSILFIDLDNFKQINDILGHKWGDAMLQKAVEVMMKNSRTTDIVARYGGDEFTILLIDCDIHFAITKASDILIDFKKELNQFPEMKGFPDFSMSIGISHSEHWTDDPGKILEEADTAMYSAKKSGKNTIVVFENINMK